MKKIIFSLLFSWLFKSVIKTEIKIQESKLKGFTDEYSHQMSMQKKARMYALKNQIIYAIKVLKEMEL